VIEGIANDYIWPCRFVSLLAGTPVTQFILGSAQRKIVGISSIGTRFPPGSALDDGFVAIPGERMVVYAAGRTERFEGFPLLHLAESVECLSWLGCGEEGKAINAGQSLAYALAINAGHKDDIIRVMLVRPMPATPVGVMADYLEEQGCPQEWIDKLRGFN